MKKLSALTNGSERPRSYLIAATLRDAIYRGELVEGEQLFQSALADQLGVSPIPLREALKQLESEGLVTFVGRRGAVVTGLADSDAQEIYDMITWLELGLLERAFPYYRPGYLEALCPLLDRMEAEEDPIEWKEMNCEFHTSLYTPSDRPMILDQLSVLRRQVDRYIRSHLEMMREQSENDHREILRALMIKDLPLATSHLRKHLCTTSGTLQKLMKK